MLVFYYGAMGSGKSAYAVMTAYHRNQPDAKAHPTTAILATTLDRAVDVVSSRTGMSAPALQITPGRLAPAMFGTADTIVVDEAQFLTAEDVEVLVEISNAGREVICFGLRTDFRGRLFPGSQRLMELADSLWQVPLDTRCAHCNRQAVINARVVDGDVVTEGPQVSLGDIARSGDPVHATYEPMCVSCWFNATGRPPRPGIPRSRRDTDTPIWRPRASAGWASD